MPAERISFVLFLLINLAPQDLYALKRMMNVRGEYSPHLIPVQVILKKQRRSNILNSGGITCKTDNKNSSVDAISLKTTCNELLMATADDGRNGTMIPSWSPTTVKSADSIKNTLPDSDLQLLLEDVEISTARGKFANINWKAIPMKDLRVHPYYRPLPEPIYIPIDSLKGFEDCSIFRQNSWQWDALHVGRLTTSKLASCLGFYENSAAESLDIPHGLRSHDRAVGAWNDLTRKIFSWEQFQALLIANTKSGDSDVPISPRSSSCWSKIIYSQSDSTPARDDNVPEFRCKYTPGGSSSNSYQLIRYTNPQSARLAWGSAQEATAILAAINFFTREDESVVVAESGMCTFEAAWSQCKSGETHLPLGVPDSYIILFIKAAGCSIPRVYRQAHQWISEGVLPPLGASPDGLIVYADGRTEVLEVKCSSPFVSTGQQELMAVSPRGPPETVGSWHIPQLQMEMFCAGPACRSAVMVLLAVSGALVYRIARDDEVRLS